MVQDYYIGRQPIFNDRQQVVGYELLYRQRDGYWANVVDGDQATSHVIMHSFWELGMSKVVGDHKAFINVTKGFLLDKDLLPPPSPQLVLEILEDIMVDDAITAAVRDLKERGYTIALDDFVYHEDLRPLVEMADIIKLDVQELGCDRLEEHLHLLKRYPLRLLAEKVETPEMFEHCSSLGFDYYQGYFLCRPRILHGKRLPANRLNAMRMMAKLQSQELDIEGLEQLISHDPALSYRMLRYINSAAFSLRKNIQSIRHAIIYLGEKEIRRWATLIALAGIDDKPDALVNTSLVRARMCDLLTALDNPQHRDSAFVVGLFSTLDAMMDQPLDVVLEALPLSPDIVAALLHREGPYSHVLEITLAHERGDWDTLERLAGSANTISTVYLEALGWAEETSRRVHSSVA
jgi:EAL and modified HD-GYP domain-containing signal transduction protein